LRAAFRQSNQEGALLFFDEADTVLGKRLASVTQGVDAEINLTRSTMLMEMDGFSGVLVFASNFPGNYDSAFRRRISHHIRFDLPDMEARVHLWDMHLVPAIPLEAINRADYCRCWRKKQRDFWWLCLTGDASSFADGSQYRKRTAKFTKR